MDRIKILAGVAGLSILGNAVLLYDSGESVPVAVISESPPVVNAIEVKGEAQSVVAEKVATTGSVNGFTCKRDESGSRAGDLFCFDGVDKSYYLTAEEAAALIAEVGSDKLAIVVADGKVLAAPAKGAE